MKSTNREKENFRQAAVFEVPGHITDYGKLAENMVLTQEIDEYTSSWQTKDFTEKNMHS